MAGYKPLKISGMQTGLVQEREEFLLPDDAYPILENAFVWRERIKRKQGCKLLGRLRRVLTSQSLGNTVGAQLTYTYANIFASFIPAVGATETNKEIEPGSNVKAERREADEVFHPKQQPQHDLAQHAHHHQQQPHHNRIFHRA